MFTLLALPLKTYVIIMLFVLGRGIPLPPPTEATNTEDLCRRLEQKIESLTKMGGSLQKENRGKFYLFILYICIVITLNYVQIKFLGLLHLRGLSGDSKYVRTIVLLYLKHPHITNIQLP